MQDMHVFAQMSVEPPYRQQEQGESGGMRQVRGFCFALDPFGFRLAAQAALG